MSSDKISTSEIGAKARLDFKCIGDACDGAVEIRLADVGSDDWHGQVVCPKCHKAYCLDEQLKDKLRRMLDLVLAIRAAGDILGDCAVSVNTKTEEIRIPYAMLLTRLNTFITLDVGVRKVDFHLWVEPSANETFR